MKFLLYNIFPELIWIWNGVYEICAKYNFGRNIYVRSKFSYVGSSHDLCARAHMQSLAGTLGLTQILSKSYKFL